MNVSVILSISGPLDCCQQSSVELGNLFKKCPQILGGAFGAAKSLKISVILSISEPIWLL